MKTLSNLPQIENHFENYPYNFHQNNKDSVKISRRNIHKQHLLNSQLSTQAESDHTDLVAFKVLSQMTMGMLPDLWDLCHQLYHTFYDKRASYTAMQFIPVLKQMNQLTAIEIERFINNPLTNHVLIQNELLKVVLIHWKPGKYSSVHGHPSGGCVFKVLHGAIEEKRYTPEVKPELLAVSKYKKGSMAYIDDQMAYHAVGNPFKTTAVSLHVYTPGLKKS